jgi:hypothetical protein
MTTTQELLDDARARVGLDDIGSPHVLDQVEAVAADLDAGTLHELGRRIVRSQVVATLVRRLRLVETWRRHPAIAEIELPPIVHISGLPRSGTTLLHNLLHRHPRVRTLQSWELKEPLPPPEAATYDSDPRIAAARAALDPLRGSDLERHHWVEPDEPDENQWALTDLHGLLGRGATAALPAWAEVVHDRDRSLVPSFTELRRTLQLLLWRNPTADGQVLVLKDPTTTSHLADFVEVFPRAQIVVVHRDPHRVAVSATATASAIVAPIAAGPLKELGWTPHVGMDWLTGQLDGLVAGLEAAGDRTHHLAYATLVDDPIGTSGSLLDDLGLDSRDQTFVASATSYLEWQHDGGRARPRRAYDERGVTRELVHGHPTVAAYVERFDVAPEQRRLTGTGT